MDLGTSAFLWGFIGEIAGSLDKTPERIANFYATKTFIPQDARKETDQELTKRIYNLERRSAYIPILMGAGWGFLSLIKGYSPLYSVLNGVSAGVAMHLGRRVGRSIMGIGEIRELEKASKDPENVGKYLLKQPERTKVSEVLNEITQSRISIAATSPEDLQHAVGQAELKRVSDLESEVRYLVNRGFKDSYTSDQKLNSWIRRGVYFWLDKEIELAKTSGSVAHFFIDAMRKPDQNQARAILVKEPITPKVSALMLEGRSLALYDLIFPNLFAMPDELKPGVLTERTKTDENISTYHCDIRLIVPSKKDIPDKVPIAARNFLRRASGRGYTPMIGISGENSKTTTKTIADAFIDRYTSYTERELEKQAIPCRTY